MPKLWSNTIEAHRGAVREAILDTTWELATEQGPASVTMSEIAEKAGIGRATLYKYFPEVGAILAAWHDRQIHRHLAHLAEVRDKTRVPSQRLGAVLEAYAYIQQWRVQHHPRGRHGTELVALLHRGDHVAPAREQLQKLIRDLLHDAVKVGDIRDDITTDELATYCLHALTAASTLSSDAAIRRLVTITLTGLRPTPRT